jgi:hypothetical protein
MVIIRILAGMLIVGIAFKTNDKYSGILLVEGLFIINYAIMSMFRNKSINIL